MIMMEGKKQYYLNLEQYEGENFALREKVVDFSHSSQLFLYPKFMVVNKNSIDF